MDADVKPMPIRTDESNRFACNTMKNRFPGNIDEVISANPDLSVLEIRQLEQLAQQVRRGDVIPPPKLPSWDYELWMDAYKEHAGSRWNDAQWFFSETYAYRLVLDACRYWEHGRDPYWYIKHSEYIGDTVFSMVSSLSLMGGLSTHDRLLLALHASLLGNKSDLSFSRQSRGLVHHGKMDKDRLIIDDGASAVHLLMHSPSLVNIVLDNSGSELAGDLLLARELVSLTGCRVILHVKIMPIFVSDTTAADVHHCLQEAAGNSDPHVRTFAQEVKEYIDSGRILIAPDIFWCSPYFLEQMPERIYRILHSGSSVIFKGDLNYRRIVRDTIWPGGTTVRQAMGSVDLPAMIMLRVMKSDVSAGFTADQISSLDRADPLWRTNGHWGIIQTAEGEKSEG